MLFVAFAAKKSGNIFNEFILFNQNKLYFAFLSTNRIL